MDAWMEGEREAERERRGILYLSLREIVLSQQYKAHQITRTHIRLQYTQGSK